MQSGHSNYLSAFRQFPGEKIVGFFMFGQPIFVINDMELSKRVLVKDYENFMDRYLIPCYGTASGIALTGRTDSTFFQSKIKFFVDEKRSLIFFYHNFLYSSFFLNVYIISAVLTNHR